MSRRRELLAISHLSEVKEAHLEAELEAVLVVRLDYVKIFIATSAARLAIPWTDASAILHPAVFQPNHPNRYFPPAQVQQQQQQRGGNHRQGNVVQHQQRSQGSSHLVQPSQTGSSYAPSSTGESSAYQGFFASHPSELKHQCFLSFLSAAALKRLVQLVIDSGASRHYFNDRSLFVTFRPYTDYLTQTNGDKLEITGSGMVRLMIGGEVLELEAECVPSAVVNILSVNGIRAIGGEAHFAQRMSSSSACCRNASTCAS